MANFQISPLFQKNRDLKNEEKNLRKENRNFKIFIFCSIVIILISVGLLGKNFSESHQIDYELSTLASAVQAANDVVEKAREDAEIKQQDAVDEAASILAASEEEASKIVNSAKEGK